MALPQGDLGLLESDVAQRLLHSPLPARMAYTGRDGKPRVVPIWFHWTGEELVMASFAGATKASALRANPDVAVTIDTEPFPPEVLLVRGTRAGHRCRRRGTGVRAGGAALSRRRRG
jgi:Pyridoxamine 5'-phosphate oxidase